MATTSLSYTISYGFTGGPLHARKFKNLMEKAGFVYTLYTQKADIIIAHSAGTWLIPEDCQPKLVVYVGMPLAQLSPFKSWAKNGRMAMGNGHKKEVLRTRIRAIYYGLLQPRRNIRIIRRAKHSQPTIFEAVPAVFIANRQDPWPKDERLEQLVGNQNWAFIDLPGIHDDIWHNPDYYVEIIEHYARLLA